MDIFFHETQEENSCASMEPFLGVVALLQCKTVEGGCPTVLMYQYFLRKKKKYKIQAYLLGGKKRVIEKNFSY